MNLLRLDILCTYLKTCSNYFLFQTKVSTTNKVFRALKLSHLENFRALKLSYLESFRALKASNLATGTTSFDVLPLFVLMSWYMINNFEIIKANGIIMFIDFSNQYFHDKYYGTTLKISSSFLSEHILRLFFPKFKQ